MKKTYMLDDESTLTVSNYEFFDALTAYANIILPAWRRPTWRPSGRARRSTTS